MSTPMLVPKLRKVLFDYHKDIDMTALVDVIQLRMRPNSAGGLKDVTICFESQWSREHFDLAIVSRLRLLRNSGLNLRVPMAEGDLLD